MSAFPPVFLLPRMPQLQTIDFELACPLRALDPLLRIFRDFGGAFRVDNANRRAKLKGILILHLSTVLATFHVPSAVLNPLQAMITSTMY